MPTNWFEWIIYALVSVLPQLPAISVFFQRKTHVIECEEMERVSMPLWRPIEDRQVVQIKIGESSIRSMSFSRMRIRNKSTKVIQDIKVVFSPTGASIVTIAPKPTDPLVAQKFRDVVSNGDKGLGVTYLNPGDEVEIYIFYDAPTQNLKRLAAYGEGPGWKLWFRDLESRWKDGAIASLLVYTGTFVWVVGKIILSPPLDWTVLIGFLPAIALAIGVSTWAVLSRTAIPGPREALLRLLGRVSIETPL